MVGSAVTDLLSQDGHRVIRLVRRQPNPGADEVGWNPGTGTIDAGSLAGIEGVVHLAGESINGRWTDDKKARILGSRVNGTRLLSETIAKLDPRPSVMVCASAYGFYGDKGDRVLSEENSPGTDFLAVVTRQWEAATEAAHQAGIRVVNLRFGIILSGRGGALAQMLPPFKLGLGAKLGSGRQYMSWVTLEDATRAIQYALTHQDLQGPVNVTSPNPVTNEEFTKALGRVLSRPTALTVPEFVMRIGLGEMAETLLASIRAEPAKLEASGFEFNHTQIEEALRSVLQEQPVS